MKIEFKKRVVRTILWMVAGFLVLFIFRFIYGYTTGMSEVQEEYFSDFFSDVSDLKRNYASSKYRYVNYEGGGKDYVTAPAQQGQGGAGEVNVDQKYEKIAPVKSITNSFGSD